jgi:hypothetical protein
MKSSGIVFNFERRIVLPAFDPTGWAKYVDVTISHDQVDGDCADFPLCIQGNDMPAGFWTNVQADGGDLVVCQADNLRRLHCDIDYISVGDTKLALHAKVPNISADYDTVVRVYYSNAAAAVGNSPKTWRPEYKFVSHMSDYPGDATRIWDSTINRNHGTKGEGAAAPTEVAGSVGRAQQFSGGQSILAAAIAGTPTQFTYTALWKRLGASGGSADSAYHSVFRGGIRGNNGNGVSVISNGAFAIAQDKVSGVLKTSVRNLATNNVWQSIHGTWDGANVTAWENGQPGTPTVAVGSLDIGYTGLRIGYYAVNYNHVNGLIDELRLSSVAWGPEWIALEHKTLLDPTTLYGISAEQSV